MVTTRSMSRIAVEGEIREMESIGIAVEGETKEMESIGIAAEGETKEMESIGIAAEGETRETESIVSRAKPVGSFKHAKDLGETLTWSNCTIDCCACILFMKDYVKQYYVNHPPRPTRGILPHEVNTAGQSEWRNMSATEQAPWFQMVTEAPALCYFVKDYAEQYYIARPRPTPKLKGKEVIRAGKLKWRNMSATEKAPWIKKYKSPKGKKGRSADEYYMSIKIYNK